MPVPSWGPVPRPDLSDVDWGALSSWGTRLAMASLGWSSDLRFSARRREGIIKLEVGIWLKHAHWHGTLCEVTVPLFRSAGLGADSPTEGEVASSLRGLVPGLVRDAADLSRRLWDEFPDGVPCRGAGGRWVENEREADYFRNYPGPQVVLPERGIGTEALPGHAGFPPLAVFLDPARQDGDAWTEAPASAVAAGFEVNDRLRRQAMPGNEWATEGRRWTYAVSPLVPRSVGGNWLPWPGNPGLAAPKTFSTDVLSPIVVAHFASGVCAGLAAMAVAYAPSGKPGEDAAFAP